MSHILEIVKYMLFFSLAAPCKPFSHYPSYHCSAYPRPRLFPHRCMNLPYRAKTDQGCLHSAISPWVRWRLWQRGYESYEDPVLMVKWSMSGYRSFIKEAHTEIQSKDFTAFLSAFENMAKLGNHKDPIESRSSIGHTGVEPGSRVFDFGQTLQPFQRWSWQFIWCQNQTEVICLTSEAWMPYEFELGGYDEMQMSFLQLLNNLFNSSDSRIIMDFVDTPQTI